MIRLAAVVWLVGCAAAGSSSAGEGDPALASLTGVASAAASASASANHPELQARLAKEPLEGLVIAHERAQFFATVAAARAAGSALYAAPGPSARSRGKPEVEPRDGPALRVLQDLGEVVKVATDAGVSGFMRLDERFNLELFVRREALLPVLLAPRAKSFVDGTGYAVREGAVLSLTAPELRAADPLLAALPLALGPADVGLSFAIAPESKPDAASEVPGPELGCQREPMSDGDSERTRVDDRDALVRAAVQERAAKSGAPDGPHLGGGWDPRQMYACGLADSLSHTVGVTNSPLSIDGREIGKALDVRGDRCDSRAFAAWRIPDKNDAIVSFSLRRASLRVRTRRSALTESGGCGAGFAGGKRPMVLAVDGKAPVFFPDGSPAGTHVARRTKLALAKDNGDRWCIELGYIGVPVCFDKADVKEVEDSR